MTLTGHNRALGIYMAIARGRDVVIGDGLVCDLFSPNAGPTTRIRPKDIKLPAGVGPALRDSAE